VEKRRRACCIGLAVQAGVHNPHGSGHKSDNCRLQKAGSIQRDERDAPRSAQEPQQLETIDVVWHEDQIYVAGTFNRRLCMYRLLAIFHPSRFGWIQVRFQQPQAETILRK
jgi:hypothetical protein